MTRPARSATTVPAVFAFELMRTMKSSFVFFPFDLFGSAGAGGGVSLLADELREILADNRRERVPTRARAYTDQVRLREFRFETLEAYAEWRRQGRQAVRQVLRQGDCLFWITGNHLGALPVYDELAGADDSTLVVQFDAHLDIHHFRDCTPELSHGNFLLHCEGSLPPIINVGHRDLLLPRDYIDQHYRHTFAATELAIDPQPALAQLRERSRQAQRVFIDVDCDVFDPVFFPAVTQPVPFGLSPPLVLQLLDAAWSERVAGVFLSEFDPGRDHHDRSLAIVVWLLEYMLLRQYEAK
ncbi:MAG TPA: arginase family protein [Gemmataceae bacterium]|nr:arginase family protein [Gemmataceae bacterium]